MNEGIFSVLGVFDTPRQLLDAIPVLKGKVPGRLEAYTPYPVHGMEKALELRKSPVGGMVFVMGLIGAFSAIAFQLWTSGIDYPMMTAGKPYLSWEAFVPIMFEATVLFACFTSGLGMLLLLNRLPFFRHPMLRSKAMPLITLDKFILAVESDGRALDVDAISSLLREAGAQSLEVVEQPAPPGPVSPGLFTRVFAVIGISCLAAGVATYWAVKLFPRLVPVVHMQDQPRLDPQRGSDFFADGSGMRMPVAGTVARGFFPYGARSEQAASVLENPLPVTDAVLKTGRQGFATYCSVCHGILGDGATTLTAAYGAKPANLVSQQIIQYTDGRLYHAITAGKNAMPSYVGELTLDERWAVVHYIRTLQRALNARDEDIPKEAAK